MKHCEDCGTRLEAGGVCPNCHEELFIMNQDDTWWDFSEDFCKKAEEQRRIILSKPASERGGDVEK